MVNAWVEIERVMLRPFAWGACDCCTAVCDVFEALHGFDPMAPWRGRYDGPRAAMRLVSSFGGMEGLLEAAARRADLVEVAPRAAAAGAIGVAAPNEWAPLGAMLICAEPGEWVGKSGAGYVAGVTAERAYECRR
jgi:hypothetical protein